MTKGGLSIGSLSGELVWSCEGCHWIHRPEVASLVLQKILEILKRNESLTHNKFLKIRREVLEAFPP